MWKGKSQGELTTCRGCCSCRRDTAGSFSRSGLVGGGRAQASLRSGLEGLGAGNQGRERADITTHLLDSLKSLLLSQAFVAYILTE